MKRLGTCFLYLVLLISSAPSYSSDMDAARSLEQHIQEKLGQAFSNSEFMVDLQVQPETANSNGSSLPGLEALGKFQVSEDKSFQGQVPTTKSNLLLILDKSVSKERARIAEEIVKRIVKNTPSFSQTKVEVKRQELAIALKPEPEKPGLLESISTHKKMLLVIALIFWSAIASLMAAHIIVKKWTGAESAQQNSSQMDTQPRRDEVKDKTEHKRTPLALSKDELYSKDQEHLKAIKDVIDEAKSDPKKLSNIFTRFANGSDDNAKFAAIFLKNCDVKTIEAICSQLHPSDLGKILQVDIKDFDIFSEENRNVVERIRQEMALLAAEQLMGEKPEPLAFLKNLSEEDLSEILQGESIEDVSLVLTQIPMHRIQSYLGKFAAEDLTTLTLRMTSLEVPRVEVFQQLSDRLIAKSQSLSSNLFSEKSRVLSVLNLLQSFRLPVEQASLLKLIRQQNKELYEAVRPKIVCAQDLGFFSERLSSILFQTIDAETLGCALAKCQEDFGDLMQRMPPNYRTIFSDALFLAQSEERISKSWQTVVNGLKDLVNNGFITATELSSAIQASDLAPRSINVEESDDAQAA